ncbi:MAG: flagellar hook-length control protein FliK [Micavibrio sp.]
MSDINVFYTQQARTTANSAASGQPAAGITNTGVNFFDLIFARLMDNAEQPALIQTPETETDPKGKTAIENSGQDLMALIASTIKLDGETEIDLSGLDLSGIDLSNLDLSGIDLSLPANTNAPIAPENGAVQITLNPAGAKKLQAALQSLLQGIPADQRPIVLNIPGGQLKAALNKLDMGKLKIESGDINPDSQNLIATGLSPEDLTKLMQMIAQADGEMSDEALTDESLQAVLIGIVKIVPDGEKTQSIFLPRALVFTKTEDGKTTTTEPAPAEEIAAILNPLSIGGVPAPTAAPGLPALRAEIDADGVKGGKDEGGFDDVLKLLEQIQAKTADKRGGTPAPGLENAMENIAAKAGPSNSTLGSSFAGTLGTLMNSSTLGDLFPDGMDWSQGAISNTQITGTAQLASLVTHGRDATQPHAATQIVAATLSRSVQNGETKNMTLRLDPPELGRIEIQMHFTKDKSVKTHMIFEKPETMLMMQRDSQTLERAMQQAGMDAGGNELSFELAGQDHAFDDRGGHDGSHGKDTRAEDGTEIATIETTMSWTVDANTGLQHYSILA